MNSLHKLKLFENNFEKGDKIFKCSISMHNFFVFLCVALFIPSHVSFVLKLHIGNLK